MNRLQTFFSVRIYFILFCCCIISVFQVSVLVNIYINKREKLLSFSQGQYIRKVCSTFPRKSLYDVNGRVIACSRDTITAFCNPRNISGDTLSFLKDSMSLMYEKINRAAGKYFCILEKKITDQAKIALLKKYSKDITLFHEYHRSYALPEATHVIGIVDGEERGVAGLEMSLESILFKDNEYVFYECDAQRKGLVSKNNILKKDNEKPIVCTLDSRIQHDISFILKDALHENEAQDIYTVVMNPLSGDIVAMAQYPFFIYEEHEYSDETAHFLKNKCISDAHEMGSVMKAFCMLACLEEAAVEPDEVINCQDTKVGIVGGRKVNTWKAHGEISYKDVIKQSNNIGCALVAMRINEKLYDHYINLNFGFETDIGLPAESGGSINPPNKWSDHSIISLSYGYEISTTLLQLASAWSVFVNNGSYVYPRILTSENIRKRNNLYSSDTVNKARFILEFDETTQWPCVKKVLKNWSMFGKTGTANIIENGSYNKDKCRYSFVGHIENKENQDKKYIIAVHVNQTTKQKAYASTIAMPVFCKVVEVLEGYLI